MKDNELIIGAHFSFSSSNNYFLGLIEEMIRVNATGAALFVGPPQSKLLVNISPENISQAHKLAKENNIDIEKFVVHARYLVNLANSTNPDNLKFSIDLMIQDIETTHKLGIKYLNFHPGSSLGKDPLIAMETLSNSINYILEQTKNTNVILLLETMMAKGNYIGKNFEQLKQIISKVNDKKRIGVCIDTCHIWDAGYDIKNNLENVIEDFDNIIGLKYLKAFHINDSKNNLNSHKDRHENIGKGYIGLELFQNLIKNEKINHLPFILETPWYDSKTPAYKDEINLIRKKN